MEQACFAPEATRPRKWVFIVLSLSLLGSLDHASAVDDLYARERANRENEQKDAGPASGIQIIAEGEEVTLEGFFVTAQGLDEREQLVPYDAIQLQKPIAIRFEDGIRENISHLKLWLEDASPSVFYENASNLLRVTGKVHYAWHGPSSFINPAKFHVSKVDSGAVAQNSNQSDSSAASSSNGTDNSDSVATTHAADDEPDLVSMGTLERLNDAESIVNHVNGAIGRMNENSLVLEMERGTAVNLVLPHQLTAGGIIFVPELSEGVIHEPTPLYDMGNLMVATFKDDANPRRYFVYLILRENSEPRIPLRLTELYIYTFSDAEELAKRVVESVRNTNSPWRDNWGRSKSARVSSLINAYNLLDGSGNPAHRPQEAGCVDLLTPIYRSHDKFKQWEDLAVQKQPPDFDKLLPSGTGLFRWTSNHRVEERKGQQVAFLCPIPPSGYQNGRKAYDGWTADMVNDLMRALHFYPAARSQVIDYQKAHAEKLEGAAKSIEETFR